VGTITEKTITDFHVRAISAKNRTATVILDAASEATDGNPQLLADYVKTLADTWKVKATPGLEQILQETSEAKQARAERERKERIDATIKTYTVNGDTQALVDGITKEHSATRHERNRFTTGANYLQECKLYDPEKDFSPSLFAGLRCPNGTLHYIGARPGGGKSTALVNIGLEALEQNRRVFLVNLEMLNKTIVTNFILSSMYHGANKTQKAELAQIQDTQSRYYSLFRRESDTRETFDNYRETAIKKITALLGDRLFVYDGTGNTLEPMLLDIKSRISQGDVILIDYIQRVPPPKDTSDTRYIQIKMASNQLLNTAIEKSAVIISGAQIGREASKEKREAALQDFREAGDIENDAHNAIALESIGDPLDGLRYVHVLKAREGGALFSRIKTDCRFNYLYMAGMKEQYTPPKPDKTGNDKKPKPGYNDPYTSTDGEPIPV
jgi:hypothetical protein